MTEEMMAFWKYDQFPFLLGGTVNKMFEDGRVRTIEYGGYSFRPVFIVPKETGKKLKEDLENSLIKYNNALAKLKESSLIEVNELTQKFGYTR